MITKGTCGMCQGGCQVLMTIEDGKLVKIEPDRESPVGRLCVRGALAPKILYGKERITRPIIRTGERGEGKFREVSWEEAFEHAAHLLRETANEYGGRSLASYYGRGVLGTPVTRMSVSTKNQKSFLKRLGSPNDMNCGSICNTASSTITPITTLGIGTRQMIQEVEESDYIISWGKNSTTDDGPQMMLKRIKEAKKRGAKLIVIDPRQTGLGEIADWWLPVTPGADGALALAMLKHIIKSNQYDHEFVETYTKGFDEFCAYLDTLEMEQLSAWCGISEEDIRKLADIFCSTTRISLVAYTGLEYQLSAIQNNRAIYVLWAITGKLDAPGSIYLNARNMPTVPLKDMPEEEEMPIGAREYPIFYKFAGNGQFSCVPEAVLNDRPYPVRGLLVIGGSPALSFPDSKVWRAAYQKLKCMIVIDRYLTEDARYADVVFPACTLFECPKAVPGPEGVRIQEPVIHPVGEAKNDVLIIAGIAKKLGIAEGYPQNEEELRTWLVQGTAPCAGDFRTNAGKVEKHYYKYKTGELRADGKPGFPTPSGKLEICSTYLAENGYTPYPEYRDIRSIEEMNQPEYPFTMTSGARSNHRMGVFGANIPEIAAIEPYPLADLNPEDAKELGISEGEMVRVSTPFGSGTYKARICGMARHAIHIPHGGGSSYMTEPWKEGNVNDLCSLKYADPISGFVLSKSVPCRVEKGLDN